MNGCQSYMENLSAYLDGELSQADKLSFEEHIHSCEACSGELALMKAIISSCSELEEDLPEGFEASLHKRLEAVKDETASKKKLARVRLYSQIAAGFVLVVALGMVVRSGIFMRKSSGSAASPEAPMASASMSGQGAKQELEDNRETNQAQEDGQIQRPLTAAMKSAPPPSAPPELMAESVETKEKVVVGSDTFVAFTLSEGMTNRVEGYDTIIRIEVSDISKALDSIMAIEKKLEAGDTSNFNNLAGQKQQFERSADQSIDVKLFYTNDALWQKFLGELQSAFPDMIVESVTAQEDQEYIRVVLVKAK